MKVLELIESQIKKLQDIKLNDSEKIEYTKEIIKIPNNFLSNELTPFDIIFLILMVECPHIDFYDGVTIAAKLSRSNDCLIIVDPKRITNSFQINVKFENLNQFLKENVLKINELEKIVKLSAFTGLLKTVNEHDMISNKAIAEEIFRKVQESIEKSETKVRTEKALNRIVAKETKVIVDQLINSYMTEPDFASFLNKFNEVIKQHKLQMRDYISLKNQIPLYEITLKKLKKLFASNNLITNWEFLKTIDNDIKIEILNCIYEHNNKIHNKIIKQKNQILGKEISHVEKILLEYGYLLNNYTKKQREELILNSDVEAVSFLLKNVDFLGLKDLIPTEVGFDILLNIEKSELMFIVSLLKKEIITSSLIINNYELLFSNNKNNNPNLNPNHAIFMEKIFELSQRKYNIKKININELISCDLNNLLNYLVLANSYNLEDKENINFSLVNNKSLFYQIDMFIELGLDNYICRNFNLIGEKSELIIKRILICQLLEIEWYDNEKIDESCLSGKNFIVDDSQLDEIIINQTQIEINNQSFCFDIHNNDVSKINDFNFLENDSCYLIGDSLISKNKFNRNLNSLLKNGNEINFNTVFYSLIYGSIFDETQIINLKEELKNTIHVK